MIIQAKLSEMRAAAKLSARLWQGGDAHRGRGLTRELLAACESWAADVGCGEFSSDCELENTASLRFHLGCGFEEAGRIICFVKKLDPRVAGTNDL